ncbi:MAG: type II toxin-antitoxin system HicA family toxin [Lachnospiraceae bacterium]|nr:type II toxin-antitoxin system HicA family toxin [Lachnospiraceae bacterium]
MKPRDQAIRFLNENGYYLVRHGGNHDQYRSEITKATIPLKRHDFDEDDFRYIRQGSQKKQSKVRALSPFLS